MNLKHITLSDLSEAVAKASAARPELAGRLEKAQLILAVYATAIKKLPDSDTFEVPSLETGKDGQHQLYRVGKTCTCVDFTRQQAPGGWCKHRLAVLLGSRLEKASAPVTNSLAEELAATKTQCAKAVAGAADLLQRLEAANSELAEIQAANTQLKQENNDLNNLVTNFEKAEKLRKDRATSKAAVALVKMQELLHVISDL